MALFLVRHGESTSNAGAATETPGEAPLTLRGRRQAMLLAAQFEHVDVVITSRYTRAMETGDLLASIFQAQLIRWDDLQEWNLLEPSKYGGTTHQQRESAVQQVVELWDPDYCDGPGAESFNALLYRVRQFWGRCYNLPQNKTIVIVSHGWFMRALMWDRMQLPLQSSPGEPRLQGSDRMKSFWSFARTIEINNCQHFCLTP